MNDDQGNPLRASHLFSSLYSDPTWKTKNLYHAFDILELPTFTFPVSIVLLASSDFAPQSVPLSGPVFRTAPRQRWLHSQPWNATEFATRLFNFLVGWFPRPQWKSWRTISQRWLMAVVSHGLMTISLLFSSVSPMISVSRQKRDAMCSMWEPTLLHLCLPSPSLQGKRTTWVPGNSVCTDRHRSCWLICWTWVYIHSWDCSDAPLRLLQGTRFRVGASWPPVFWDSMHRCLCLIIPDFDKDSTGIWSSG